MAKTTIATDLQTTLTTPEKDAQRVLTAFTTVFGYNSETDGTPDGFFKTQLIKYAKSIVIDYESRLATKDAKTKVQKEVEAIGIS